MEGTLNISYNSISNSNKYLSFVLIPTAFIVLETCVFSASSKRLKNITTQETQFIEILHTVPK